ncbi:hypothetical protein AMTRI_Chr06g174600 [Amborella trichopoda]
MYLTAHHIDSDWILKKKIVNFKLVPYPHSNLDKLFAITMDNCTTNDIVVKKLKENLFEKILL